MVVTSVSNAIVNNYFGNVRDSVPTTYYIGLSTTPLNEDGTGYTEPSGGNYSRVAVTNNTINFSTASNGTTMNLTEIMFNESSLAWGTILYVFVASASTGATVMYYDALTTARTVQAETTLLFDVGTFQVQLTNVTTT